jgi:hypothetical protein
MEHDWAGSDSIRWRRTDQNSKVIGTYDNVATNGQTRIPTVITRIIFPDSSSIPIGAMPAGDQGGFAGLHDQVDTHLWERHDPERPAHLLQDPHYDTLIKYISW